jgi:NADH:ubiquinone oxidoreductase subunit 5 (subunit L)/multisubunit Na+/H+ antiporter MnhA subunit
VTEQLLISAMLILPLAGWLLAAAMPARQNSATAFFASLTGVVAVSWIVCSRAGIIQLAGRLAVGDWLVIPSADGLTVSLTFQADQSHCVLVLAASMLVLFGTVGANNSETLGSSRVSLLYPLSVAAILVTDLVVLVSIWIAIDCCVFSLFAQEADGARPVKRRFSTTTILSCSGALLFVTTLLAMSRFGTSDIAEIVALSVEDKRIDAATVAAGLSVLIVAAVAIRCAFFPALIWPRTGLEFCRRSSGIVVVLAGILPGISLAVASSPLGSLSPDAFLLLGMLGVLTCLTATGVALAQTDSARVVALLSIAVAGLAAAGLATSLPTIGHVTTYTLFAQLMAIFVLQRCSGVSKRGAAFGIAMLVAVCGIGGGNALLSLVEVSLRGIADAATVSSAGRFLVLIWWGVVLSQTLWGVAIWKLVSIQPSTESTRNEDANASRLGDLVPTIAVCLALSACMVPLGGGLMAQSELSARLLTFGAATPACLLGVVSAWLLSQASDAVRGRVTGSLDSLTRLCREWFYIEDAIRYGAVMPVRGLALLAEFCDRRILGGRSEDGWKHAPIRIAGSFEYLRDQPAVYYGLTGVLLLVGLLWTLA